MAAVRHEVAALVPRLGIPVVEERGPNGPAGWGRGWREDEADVLGGLAAGDQSRRCARGEAAGRGGQVVVPRGEACQRVQPQTIGGDAGSATVGYRGPGDPHATGRAGHSTVDCTSGRRWRQAEADLAVNSADDRKRLGQGCGEPGG